MEKKPKTFSTVQEFLEAYFPSYEKRRQEFSNTDYEENGVAWALKMAKEYEPRHKPPLS